MSSTSDDMMKSAFPMFNMMLKMQRMGLQAMSAYQPLVSTFLDGAAVTERAARQAAYGATHTRFSDAKEVHDTNEEQVIGVGEEVLNVGTRMIPGKTTRIRRVVVQNPVQQDVTLHTETVVLERRKPIQTDGSDVLTEVTIEMSDFNEVPVVSKSVHLVEEVLLRKEITARVETIHDTVRRDKLEIEQPSNLPVVQTSNVPTLVTSPPKQDEKKRDDFTTGESQERKSANTASQAANKAGDQKRS